MAITMTGGRMKYFFTPIIKMTKGRAADFFPSVARPLFLKRSSILYDKPS